MISYVQETNIEYHKTSNNTAFVLWTAAVS